MSVGGWLEENTRRAYPLIGRPGDSRTGLPDPAALVDFGCVVAGEGGYDPGSHSVWLASVALSAGGDVLTFRFGSDAAGLRERFLEFEVVSEDGGVTWPAFGSIYESTLAADSDNPTGSLPSQSSSSSAGVPDAFPVWEGFLVLGDPSVLAAAIGPGGSAVYSPPISAVEPARIQSMGRLAVRALSAANKDRVRVTPPDGCGGGESSDQNFVSVRDLTGRVSFREGYNLRVSQSSADNSITLSAAVGAGAGEACVEVPVYPGESAPAGSSLLTGGPACGEVLTSVNGVEGPSIQIRTGPGVSSRPGDADNELVVEIDLSGLAVCQS